MARYTLMEAEGSLSDLFRRALGGEAVTIQHGADIVELRPADKPRVPDNPEPGQDFDEWLRLRRDSRPGATIGSVELMEEVYRDYPY